MTAVDVRPYAVPFARPFTTARGTLHEREGWLVRTHDGTTEGWGEAAPLPGTGTEPHEVCAAALADAGDALPATPAARHGVALAQLDLEARRRGVPLAALLAEDHPPRANVDVNAVLDARADAAAEAQRLVDAGYRTVKLKADADWEATVARVAAVRDAVGDALAVRVDANGAWSRAVAERALHALARFDVAYVEQPVPAADVDALAALARAGGAPVAADEAVTGVDAARRLLDAGAAHVLVLKPMVLGGPDRALAVARLAAEHDVPVVVTTTLDAAIARAGALHVAAAVPGPLLASGLDTGPLLARDVAPAVDVVERGRMRVPTGPGLGTAPWEVVRDA